MQPRRSWLSLALLLASACRVGSGLSSLSGSLVFSSPDQPGSVHQSDAGLVEIDFGSVVAGTTKSLTLDFSTVAGEITIGALATQQADPEFDLPFVNGTQVGLAPSQISVSFAPLTLGAQSATYQLTSYVPATKVVTFVLTGIGLTNGLNVTPDPVDFGKVELKQSELIPLTITNQSQDTVVLAVSPLEGNDAGAFTLAAPAASTLAPGASTTMNATFDPLVAESFDASFVLNGWTTNPFPMSGTGITSCLQISSPLEFGFVQPSTSVVKQVVITNSCGSQAVHVTTVPLFSESDENSNFHFGFPFTVMFPAGIDAGETLSFPVLFEPTNLGFFSETLLITTDDPVDTGPVVQLEGWGGGPKISCPSPLLFGPVAVGFSETLSEVCTNVGSTVPYHPEFGLQVEAGGISVDNPAFSAILLLPDGGPASADAGLFLAAGQSATVQVTFQPPDAGAFPARLALLGEDVSDINDTDAGVTMLGVGVIPGPCQLGLVPEEVSFGEVPVGASGVLQAEVENLGQDFCILTDVSLDPKSDAAFSLRDGGPGYTLLSFVGNTDNPVGLPTSVRADVQFTPTAVENLASGNLAFTILNASPMAQSIPLTGTSRAACLTITPSSRNFGKIGFDTAIDRLCDPASQGFSVLNTCAVPVTMTSLDLSPGLDAVAQFQLRRPPATPSSIAPGTQVTFQAVFSPSAVGDKIEAINLTSSEYPSTPYLISLEGDPEPLGMRTDSFVAPRSEVDIVWIIDNDDDYPQVQNVRALLPQLIASLDEAQVDYQMAVTSTDTCNSPNSDQGFFEPCDHCLSTASPNPLFVTPATADPVDTLSDLFGYFDIPPQIHVCADKNGDEHFFDSIAEVFSPNLLSGHNAGFLRPEAFLAIIVVNGDDEDDAYDAKYGKGPYVIDLAEVKSLVRGLKPNSALVTVNYLNQGVDSLGNVPQNMGKLVQATNGVEIDTNQQSGADAFLNIFAATEGIGVYHLTSPAMYVGPFQVEVNGVVVNGWSFDLDENAIVFAPGELPIPGSTVTVTYPFECPYNYQPQ